MPLLGHAAMLLNFDVVEAAITEHDDWHTHEHLPERLSIPGFLRGTRWVAVEGQQSQPRYMVLYEVEQLGTLASDAYLARLNNPTPWTAKMMPHYRGMRRGLCTVAGSFGHGLGHVAGLVRFKAEQVNEASLRKWLLNDVLPSLPKTPGLGSAHLLESGLAPQMTNEQRIRGADAGVDAALIVSAYRSDALVSALATSLAQTNLQTHGATAVEQATYRLDYTLTAGEPA